MPRKIFFVFVVFLLAGKCFAQSDTTRIGVYINSISDINYPERSFDLNFWIWYNYANDTNKIVEMTDFPNAKSVESALMSVVKEPGEIWCAKKVKARLKNNWDLVNFPFDKQEISLKIESVEDENKTTLIADTMNSKISSGNGLEEYNIKKYSFERTKRVYNTTFGDPRLSGASSFDLLVFKIFLERNNSWTTFFKLITGVLVAFFISLSVFFIRPIEVRFGLCVGSLFASIGNKYIVESVVPDTLKNTLMDTIHIVTFISILSIIVLSIIALVLKSSDKPKAEKKLDKIAFWSILTVYLSLNTFFIARAVLS
ncbi:MAG: hypothetical protein PHN88_09675 [Ignavibacteria bacterium]|nr:hypothetical protein [Ignavibacteria bacterium]